MQITVQETIVEVFRINRDFNFQLNDVLNLFDNVVEVSVVDTDVDSTTIQVTLLIKYLTDANTFFNNVLKEQENKKERWKPEQRAY